MAEEKRSINISYKADLKDLIAKLKQMPNVTEAEAKKKEAVEKAKAEAEAKAAEEAAATEASRESLEKICGCFNESRERCRESSKAGSK